MKCEVCGSTENIVHSGVDALIMGCMEQIQRICYLCAIKQQAAAREEKQDV